MGSDPQRGRHVYFNADPTSRVFDEMRSLLAKTAGLADVLRTALVGFPNDKAQIDAAFLYGSVYSLWCQKRPGPASCLCVQR